MLPTCETVIGCIASGYLAVSGYDNAVAGYNTLFSGKPAATWGGHMLQAAGLSPEVAELFYASSQLAAAIKAPVPKPVAAPVESEAAAARNGAGSSEGSASKPNASVASWDADSEAGTSVRTPHGELSGQPELPPKNAPPEQVRAIDRQNEAAIALSKSGYDVEQLPNAGKNKANPDLKVDGDIADVFSPITNSPISVIKTIGDKVVKQASTIVVNLEDSVITIAQLEAALRANPVNGLKAVYIMKNGEIHVIKVGK